MSSGQWPRSASPVKGLKQRKTPDTTPGFFNTLFKLFRRGHNSQRQKISRLGILVMSPVLGTWVHFGFRMAKSGFERMGGGTVS